MGPFAQASQGQAVGWAQAPVTVAPKGGPSVTGQGFLMSQVLGGSSEQRLQSRTQTEPDKLRGGCWGPRSPARSCPGAPQPLGWDWPHHTEAEPGAQRTQWAPQPEPGPRSAPTGLYPNPSQGPGSADSHRHWGV